MDLLFYVLLLGAPLLLVVALIKGPAADGNRRPFGVQRAVGTLAVVAAIIPGVWLLTSGSLRVQEGLWVLLDLSFPICVALPAVLPHSPIRSVCTVVGALLLAVFCFLGGFSIGLFYVPAAVVLFFAGMTGRLSEVAGASDATLLDLATLTERLQSPDPMVREDAISVIGDRGPAAGTAVGALRPLLEDPVRRVRIRAKWALQRLGN